jgi:hypothetical protein
MVSFEKSGVRGLVQSMTILPARPPACLMASSVAPPRGCQNDDLGESGSFGHCPGLGLRADAADQVLRLGVVRAANAEEDRVALVRPSPAQGAPDVARSENADAHVIFFSKRVVWRLPRPPRPEHSEMVRYTPLATSTQKKVGYALFDKYDGEVDEESTGLPLSG